MRGSAEFDRRSISMAFTQNNLATLVRQPQNGKVQIANADGQSNKTVYTAGANGSKVSSLIAVSSDTSDRDVQICINNGGTNFPLGTVKVPLGAGNSSAVASVNLLDPAKLTGLAYDSDGNPFIHLISGDVLVVVAQTTVTAAKLITVTAATVGDF
jgi:hypothetical protein